VPANSNPAIHDTLSEILGQVRYFPQIERSDHVGQCSDPLATSRALACVLADHTIFLRPAALVEQQLHALVEITAPHSVTPQLSAPAGTQ
jgi:hypothetical protein